MTEKTFDRADLLRFFDESGHQAAVGKLTVTFPPRDLYSEETKEYYQVEAQTQAFFCERYGFAVAVQSVISDGLHHLPKHHALRGDRPLHFRYGGTSASLSRWAAQLADDWKLIVRGCIPPYPIDLRPALPEVAPDEDHDATGVSIDNPFGEEPDGAE